MITVIKKISLSRGPCGRKRILRKPAAKVPVGRTPRISKLMALAIRFEGLIREGKVTDLSELARLAHVTQPRMTQIMNLLHLAPDIQEELLFLPEVTKGRDPVHERMVRPLTAMLSWDQQRRKWAEIRPAALAQTTAS